MILSIDPGREKTGLAQVSLQGDLLCAAIVPSDQLDQIVLQIINDHLIDSRYLTWGKPANDRITQILLGNGTCSKKIQAVLQAQGLSFFVVEETHTTEEGWILYDQLFPPRGLKKLVPQGLRRPSRPIDDMAAWAIALRWLKKEDLNGSKINFTTS